MNIFWANENLVWHKTQFYAEPLRVSFGSAKNSSISSYILKTSGINELSWPNLILVKREDCYSRGQLLEVSQSLCKVVYIFLQNLHHEQDVIQSLAEYSWFEFRFLFKQDLLPNQG